MRLTLRFVISGLCAVIVLSVAAITLAITYSVSLSTVRDIGKQHTLALAAAARKETFYFFDEPNRYNDVNGDLFAGTPEFDLPSSMADQTDNEVKHRLIDILWSQSRASGHTLGTQGLVFEDASGCTVYELGTELMQGACRFRHQWPQGNMSTLIKTWWRGNGSITSNTALGNEMPPNDSDSRFAAYTTATLLVGGSPQGMWFPVSVFAFGGNNMFLWPNVRPMFNMTGQFIGLSASTRRLDGITDFLDGVRGTPNTEAFAVQSDGYLVGSTHSTPFFTFTQVPISAATPNGCSSGADTVLQGETTVLRGCRASASDFPYPPLQEAAADRTFLNTPATEVKVATVDGDGFFIASTAVPNRYRYWGLNIVLCMPEADVLGDIVSGRNTAIGVTVAVFIAAALLSFLLVYLLLQPLSDVSKRMLATAKLRETEDAREYSRLAEIQDLQRAYTNMNTAIRSFTRYVPRDVVKDLMKSGQLCTIQMTPQMCSMLFVDIAGFTTICERVPPDVLSAVVSQYFDRASRIVMEHDGLIDKFIGDCIMAVWGAPFPIANQEVKATLTGVLLNRETMVAPLSDVWDEAGELLRVRVGVSTGEVLAGNMGSADRMNYTVIGDPVNLAARLESLNKQFDTRVMVSEMTAEGLGAGVFVLRLLMPIAVVGKEKPVKAYEVMGLAGALTPEDAMALDAADTAMHTKGDLNGSMSASDFHSESSAGSADVAAVSSAYRKGKQATSTMVRDAIMRTAASDIPATCTADEVAFAHQHTRAVQQYLAADFAGAIQALQNLESTPFVRACVGGGAEKLRRPERSMTLVRELCETYLREGTPEGFDGVYRSLEK